MTDASTHTPTVSVLIPTRNGAPFLTATLESVWAQTHQPLEVIVVDDGSTDETPSILRSFASDGRLRVITQQHGGTPHARNTAVQAARGALIALLDHDDVWPTDKIARQVHLFSEHPDAVLVYGYAESFGLERDDCWPSPDGPSGCVTNAFLRKNWIRSPGQTLIRTQAIRDVGGFDPALAGADDWDLYLKLADRGSFVYAHRLALHYRVHAGNQSNRAWMLFRHACRVHSRHAGAWPSGSIADRVRWLQCRATLAHMFVRHLSARRRGSRRQIKDRNV